jgi:DNA-binding transcriptional LysR family regulator
MNATRVDLQLLENFALVAEEGSFSRTALRLGVGKAKVSRDLSQLKAPLGVELIHRTTPKVAPPRVAASGSSGSAGP